jgi:hypothetical protein
MKNQTCCCREKKAATSKLVFKQGNLYYCGDPKCKKDIEKEINEDYERTLYQGRTFKQYKTSANITYYAALGLIGFILGYCIFILVNLL